MSKVRLIAKTTGQIKTEYEGKDIEQIVIGEARLSSDRSINELFHEHHKLLRHCLVHNHWSVFDLADLSFEITTSRAIGRQLLRHFSLSPQEFSQRYAEIVSMEDVELRLASSSNRQSSSEVIDEEHLTGLVESIKKDSIKVYHQLLEAGVARECARFILPECATSKLVLKGSLRSWITFLNVRLHHTSQKEMREVANQIKELLIEECPIIARTLYYFEDAEQIHILDRVKLEQYGLYQLVKANNFKKFKSIEQISEKLELI